MDFTEILNRPFRWPKTGDKLFTASSRWDGNAHLESHGHGRLVMMMNGYKRGADLMVQQATTNRFDQDALVYPIIFNYRQYIELSLKYLIASYGGSAGVEANWKTHSLTALWGWFAEVLSHYGDQDDDGGTAAVRAIVAEFAKVDPGSFSYRYPVGINGEPIELAHDRLDLAALAEVMNAVDGYFSGCDGYLDHLQSAGP